MKDNEALTRKRAEIEQLAVSIIDAHWQNLGVVSDAQQGGKYLIECLVLLTPPENSDPVMRYVAMGMGGLGGATTRKSGNIQLSLGKIVSLVSTGILSAASVVATPWTAPFAGLLLWQDLWSKTKIEISETDATVIWTMHLNKDSNGLVGGGESLLAMTNTERQAYGCSPISNDQLGDSLKRLGQLKCIERSRTDPTKWWLREWVRIRF